MRRLEQKNVHVQCHMYPARDGWSTTARDGWRHRMHILSLLLLVVHTTSFICSFKIDIYIYVCVCVFVEWYTVVTAI